MAYNCVNHVDILSQCNPHAPVLKERMEAFQLCSKTSRSIRCIRPCQGLQTNTVDTSTPQVPIAGHCRNEPFADAEDAGMRRLACIISLPIRSFVYILSLGGCTFHGLTVS
ncbi:putative transmembrane protein [Toxoplasma gondii TgCatPRC2]|uniref:Putative transmembrane protein n=1 Tax=Toxoplasma gondii TgCatPRC2 TaxID=1130821 RepID=A0A151HIC3_TOXGO|nr:putative transmembrane protein [Toxoplasma gondii TgCatPRC2]